jgi:tetratricopeptide (TPR) repeat protein
MAEVPADLPPPTAEGTFAKTPLVQVLVYVLERSLTGTIEVVHPDGPWAQILVLDGHPSKGRTSEPVAYLGNVLHELGYIDDATLNASLSRMAKERKLHGEILLAMGKITDAQLREGLRAQLLRKVEHLFEWPADTRFTYFDAFDALAAFGADDDVQLDPLPLVWSAVRTQPPWEHVHAALTRVGPAVLRIAPLAQLERFEFNKEEKAAADLLRVQPMRVHDLVGTKLLGAATTQLLAYCLLITKQVELLAPPPQSETPLARVQLAQVSQPPASARPAIVEERALLVADPRAASSPYPPVPSPSISPAPAVAPKQAAPARVMTPQLEQRRAEILARAKAIKGEDYFEMLGVGKEAPSEQVAQAFLALAKIWHPDRIPASIADAREACATVFSHLSEAHQTLMDPQRREQYMHLLKDGGATPDEQAHVQAILEAATNFQKAEFFLRRSDLKEAEALCRKAHEADSTPAEYVAMLAWLESLKPENQGQKATLERIAMLDQAILANERLERAYFYRGMLHKRMNNLHAAVKDFRKAAELNPRNLDAVREVRLFEMRKGKGSIPPGPPEEREGRGNTGRPGPGSGSQRPPRPANKDSDPSLGRLFGKLFKK